MNFFLQIHRSIIDPSFYKEALSFSKKRVILFLVKLILITVFILASAYTWRVMDPSHGLPAILPALFPHMHITHTTMTPNAVTPYVANPLHVADCIALFTNTPLSTFEMRDSAVVVDSRSDIAIDKNSSILFLLTADLVHVKINPEIYFTFPYSVFVSKKEEVTFTSDGIAAYLRRRLITLFLNFYLQHCIIFGLNIVISLFFLSLAAFIFRTRYIKKFRGYIKLAAFAITPIAVETIMITVAGVSAPWLWHIAVFVSVFILYRGINYIARQANDASPLGE